MAAAAISKEEYLAKIAGTADLEALRELELELFGRKRGVLARALRRVAELELPERNVQGAILNQLKGELREVLEVKRRELMAKEGEDLSGDALDVSMPLPEASRGHLHLIPEFLEEVKEVFGRMGFDVFEGPELETEDINFTILNIPPDHPARDMQSTFWIKTKPGEPRKVLRTHTSNAQIHYMLSREPPFRMIAPGRVYRRDADATHSPVFHQFEGLMIGKDISLCHLKGVMIAAVKELVGSDVKFRFRASYFPFTEPSMEMDIDWGSKGNKGDKGSKGKQQWMEVAGCGMVHPQVLRNVKIDPKKWQGFAFGFGVERLLMIRHNIPDIRLFYSGDLQFIEQF
jgi:phenylalanyl-tRNA synthetase alpha chain